MIRIPPGAVLLDPAEVDLIATALEQCAQLMRERTGNHAPSRPPPQLIAFTASRLRRTGGSMAARAMAADHKGSEESPAGTASVRDTQRDSVDCGPHEMGTGEAARYLGITPNAVRDAARRKRLPARHSGTRWVFDSADVATHGERRAARGR